ncbi:solute carrier family 26 member 10-like [Ctenocephalides felis]|uniref:solute carrier family 26 member 10-like n=1 Tax=Ctenocephalides felis TaxID=7515 RepID=UPI000E6E2393|nr:solute carrier family 26 member 10-like [Ctenocephalides felis]
MSKNANDRGNGPTKPGPATPLIAVTTRGLGTYQITRNVQTTEQVQIAGGYDPPKSHCCSLACCPKPKCDRCWKITRSVCPILDWLPGYSLKRDLFGDMIAGMTTAIMHVPQGLYFLVYGICLVANVIPTAGLYMAFFPALVYVVFGSSRHVSMGTFAVVSIMVGKIVQEYAYFPDGVEKIQEIRLQFLLIMWIFRLGALSTLLCEPLINGFTTAAAVAVLISQMKDLLGLKIPRHNGMFSLPYNLYETIIGLPTANTATIIVSISVIFVMTLNNELLKPWLGKRCRMPVPAELLCAIAGTAVSYLLDLKQNYNVPIVGEIPTGLPTPSYPRFSLLRLVAVDTIAVAIVSYSIVMSLGLIFARRLGYTIRPNQELLAMGLANLVGAGFSCIPIACSLTRTMIQANIGGKTQMATVISASIILIVLLWIAPYLQYLPRVILAAIILVALKGMFMQVKDLKRFWLLGPIHAAIWVGTFLGVVFISIDMGLLIGVVLSLMTLWFGNRSNCKVMGRIPGTDLYADVSSYKLAEELPHIKIIHYDGNISFAASSSFKKSILKNIQFAPAHEEEEALRDTKSVRVIILDMSSVRHADAEGMCFLFQMKHELSQKNISITMAAPSDGVLEVIRRLESIGPKSCAALKTTKAIEAFPTIHDAVIHCQQTLNESV